MKAGQSPKSTENYKGRKKGARSAAWHEFMPAIREMSMNHLTLAEMSAQTRVPFQPSLSGLMTMMSSKRITPSCRKRW